MNDVWLLSLSILAGMALSAVMFGGLWWTLRRLPTARRPWLLALGSFWGRLAIVVPGFYLVTAGDWRRGVAALVGFLAGRVLLVRWLGTERPQPVARGA